jgi:ATP-binding cassette subfamily C protein LapB
MNDLGASPARSAPPARKVVAPAGLDIAEWLARYFDRPYSEAAVLSRLSGQDDLTAPAALADALAAVGLKTRRHRRKLRALDAIVLPCVLVTKDGVPLILTDLDKGSGTARIVDSAEGRADSAVPLADLQARIRPHVLLVTPEEDTRGAAAIRAETAEMGHWFWRPVRANWPAWTQVMLASLLLNVMGLALPLYIMNVYDKVIPNLSFVTLWTLSAGVGLAILADLVLRTIRMASIETISRRVDLKVGAALYRHALALGLLSRTDGAAGMANRIREYEGVRDFFASQTFVSFFDLIFIGIFLAVMFAIVGQLAWVPTLAVPVVLVLALAARAGMSAAAEAAGRLSDRRQAVLMESLHGIETVKALNAEPRMQRDWEAAISATARSTGRARFWSNLATNGTMMVQQLVSVGIVIWGVFLIFDGQISVGALIAANILSSRALAPLGQIAQAIFRAQYAVRAMRSLDEMMRTPAERPRYVRSQLRIREARVKIRGLNFTYPGAQVPAVAALDLDIAPGESIALLGRVGSGKTTLGKLLSGMLVQQEGTIQIDGFGLNQYDRAELREGIGYLPQNSELFTGSLRENLVLGNPGAGQEEIEHALYVSALDEFVARSPDGLEMRISEKGGRLSGGQAQALALARQILKRPRLLFLDEPTNAMDREMERKVCDRLAELNREGTALMLCTHRQSLADIADRFVILDAGRKVLDGPRAEVMRALAAKGG